MKPPKLFEMADSFVEYFNKCNTTNINISDKFIREYYIFANGGYISLVEFTKWLDISRDAMLKRIKRKLKLFTENNGIFVNV